MGSTESSPEAHSPNRTRWPSIPAAIFSHELIDDIPLSMPMRYYILMMIETTENLFPSQQCSTSSPWYFNKIKQRLNFTEIKNKLHRNQYSNLGQLSKDLDALWKYLFADATNNGNAAQHNPSEDFITFASGIEAEWYRLWDEFESILHKTGYLLSKRNNNNTPSPKKSTFTKGQHAYYKNRPAHIMDIYIDSRSQSPLYKIKLLDDKSTIFTQHKLLSNSPDSFFNRASSYHIAMNNNDSKNSSEESIFNLIQQQKQKKENETKNKNDGQKQTTKQKAKNENENKNKRNEKKERKNQSKKEKKKNEKQSLLLKDWLTNIIGLPQYFDVFVKEGFDDLTFVLGVIKEDDLLNMNITKLGHRRKILHFAGSPDDKKRKMNPNERDSDFDQTKPPIKRRKVMDHDTLQ